MAVSYFPGNAAGEQPIGRWAWLRVFLIGLVIWIAGIFLLAFTGDPNLIPFVVLWGSFLIPVSAVLFFFSHLADRVLSRERVLSAFIWGGAVGVLLAVFFEYVLLGDGAAQYIGVGLIEEGAKLIALIMVARKLGRYSLHDGLVLGAAVGFGFGAMESSGYALVAMFTQNGLSLGSLVQTEILRGLLSPLGHGLWTGILGGVLFEVSDTRLRFTKKVFGAYLLVALLHTLWDSMHGIALFITTILTGLTPQQEIGVRLGVPVQPTPAQIQMFDTVQLGGMVVISIVGIAILAHLWRKRQPFSDLGVAADQAPPRAA
jgi:RsiW-degrading membrane proteinase PrsW (M82 family)